MDRRAVWLPQAVAWQRGYRPALLPLPSGSGSARECLQLPARRPTRRGAPTGRPVMPAAMPGVARNQGRSRHKRIVARVPGAVCSAVLYSFF